MAQLTSTDLIRILGHVTAILVIPMVGGAVAGLVIDALLHTSPLFAFGGFAVGNIIAVVGILLYIRRHAPSADHPDGLADDHES